MMRSTARRNSCFAARNCFATCPFTNLYRLNAHLRLALPIGIQRLVRFQRINAGDFFAQSSSLVLMRWRLCSRSSFRIRRWPCHRRRVEPRSPCRAPPSDRRPRRAVAAMPADDVAVRAHDQWLQNVVLPDLNRPTRWSRRRQESQVDKRRAFSGDGEISSIGNKSRS